jgi:hypothetical protein
MILARCQQPERRGLGDTDMAEIIDARELAQRWNLPESWIRSKVRLGTAATEQIPHLKLGRYVRFEFGSPALEAWLACHREGWRENKK